MRVGLYARVSTHDQQTLPMQLAAMREYVERRGWTVTAEVSEIGSGAKERQKREELLKIARRREIDAIVVWRLDRWGRSLVDLVTTLGELGELGVGFVSLTEALDLTTPTGRAMAGLLAVFAEFERDILRERVKAGIAQARAEGKPHGRPRTASLLKGQIEEMYEAGMSKSEVARRLSIGRTSVRRMLEDAGSSQSTNAGTIEVEERG
jgi:DNA invertase Pin-like site-specific DNA recombinase